MIYFIRDARRKAVKIGYSAAPAKRFVSLQTSNPDTLTLLGVCPGDLAKESEVHKLFRHLRIRGEWFRENPEMLDAIKALCVGHRLKGRCPRCGVPGKELHDSPCSDGLVCDDCDPPGLPRTLHHARDPPGPRGRVPSGWGYRILRKKVQAD